MTLGRQEPRSRSEAEAELSGAEDILSAVQQKAVHETLTKHGLIGRRFHNEGVVHEVAELVRVRVQRAVMDAIFHEAPEERKRG